VSGAAGQGRGGSNSTIDLGGKGGLGLEPGPATPDGPAPRNCGDGKLTEDEACDDGNLLGGDGCAANCLGVEPGFSCSPPGVPCHVVALCGDGVVASNEMCDDDNDQAVAAVRGARAAATIWLGLAGRRAAVERHGVAVVAAFGALGDVVAAGRGAAAARLAFASVAELELAVR
jgi:cysteine-rich repeat protein